MIRTGDDLIHLVYWMGPIMMLTCEEDEVTSLVYKALEVREKDAYPTCLQCLGHRFEAPS